MIYSVHPALKMIHNWREALPAKTGKTLEEWTALVVKEGPPSPKERQAWLKEKYGFGTNHAQWIADFVEGRSSWEGDPAAYLKAAPLYVEQMYAAKPLLPPCMAN